MKVSVLIFTSLASACLAGCQSHTSSPPVSGTSPGVQVAVPAPKSVEAPAVKDVRLGDSLANLKSKYSNALCPGDPMAKSIGCIVNGISYGTLDGMMVVNFVDDKAVSISVQNIDPSGFGTLSTALTTKLGPPSDIYAHMFGEPSGSLAWGSSTWLMTADQNFSEGKSGVLLVDRAYLATRLAEQKKKAEGDL